METISYTSAIIWYATWPLVIYMGYKCVSFTLKYFKLD